MLWRKVIVGNFGEEPSEWCSWVAREGYGVSLWKSIRKGEKLLKLKQDLRWAMGKE